MFTPPLSINTYTFLSAFREKEAPHEQRIVEAAHAAGFEALEPIIDTKAQLARYLELMRPRGLALPSFYMNSEFLSAPVAETVDKLSALFPAAREAGVEVIITNPNPLDWSQPLDKSDPQLARQAEGLDRLGARAREHGLTLAWHHHSSEHRQGAREFHHMMLATDPAHLSLCFDFEWAWTGSGHSTLAVRDLLKLYGSRLALLHLRQDRDKVWTPRFGPGDLDYPTLLPDALNRAPQPPRLTLEQAYPADLPAPTDPIADQIASREALEEMLADLG